MATDPTWLGIVSLLRQMAPPPVFNAMQTKSGSPLWSHCSAVECQNVAFKELFAPTPIVRTGAMTSLLEAARRRIGHCGATETQALPACCKHPIVVDRRVARHVTTTSARRIACQRVFLSQIVVLHRTEGLRDEYFSGRFLAGRLAGPARAARAMSLSRNSGAGALVRNCRAGTPRGNLSRRRI